MSKLIILSMFLVMLVSGISYCNDQEDPFIEPRWMSLRGQLTDDDPLVREATLIEIGELGPDANIDELIPQMVDLVVDDAGYVSATALWVNSRYDFDVDLYLNATRSNLSLMFGGGPEIENVGDSKGEMLAEMLISSDVRTRLDALDAMFWEEVYPEDVISLLVNNLSHEDSRVRTLACIILAMRGEDSGDAGEALVHALGDVDYAVVREAATAIGKIKPPVEIALPPLMNIIRDPGSISLLRPAAMYAIGAFGEDAFSAIPFLKEIMENPDDELSGVAAINLLKIDPDDTDAPLVIVAELENRSGTETSELLLALNVLDKVPSEAFPVLLDLLNVSGLVEGIMVPVLIGKIGAEPGVVETLIEIVEREDQRFSGALKALGEIGPDARDAIELISMMATNREYPFAKRAAALEVLGKMGTEPGAIEAIAEVASEIRDYDALEVGGEYPWRLWSGLLTCFDNLGELSMPSLIDALGHPNPAVRKYAVMAVSHFPEDGSEAFSVLLSLITEDPDEDVRARAASVIRSIPVEPEIILTLIEALSDDYWEVVFNSIVSLSSFEKEAQQAIPHLLKLWDHPMLKIRKTMLHNLPYISQGPELVDFYIIVLEDDHFAGIAAGRLGEIGAGAADALPALERLAAKDYGESVVNSPSEVAEDAIKKIREALEEGE